MGFHPCAMCNGGGAFSPNSSSDIVIVFKVPVKSQPGFMSQLVPKEKLENATRSWQFPIGILHYVFDHRYIPSEDFQKACLEWLPINSQWHQTRSTNDTVHTAPGVTPIGYLGTEIPIGGRLLPGFKAKLLQICQRVADETHHEIPFEDETKIRY